MSSLEALGSLLDSEQQNDTFEREQEELHRAIDFEINTHQLGFEDTNLAGDNCHWDLADDNAIAAETEPCGIKVKEVKLAADEQCCSPQKFADDHDEKKEKRTLRAPCLKGSSHHRRGNDGKRLRVEFIMDDGDSEKNSLRTDVEKEFNNIHGRKHGGSMHSRFRQPRLSLLGKPIAYRPPPDPHYRKVQSKVYNFLERPKDWTSIAYHVFVFVTVVACLLLSVLETVPRYRVMISQLLFFLVSTSCSALADMPREVGAERGQNVGINE
ncbi:uncharacterized protein LOC106180446 [Lingula anatina]|uniref:Uncharacterized protein LOC106180446 n=1 Tax=Lingula anatina TaxID=7574 RepID=A0A2R2MT34_LINAN|nr:uncharacterized protein LOC106180446 [Lingula anatina]|eukprot:XP_023933409.1 uncharacterized protein LOC106180446 [Lingula anatina]